MWIFARQFEDLAEADLRFLIDSKVAERRTLEYKAKMYGSKDEDIREMLRDVASMANAEGGVIVIGLDETKDGVARELVDVPDAKVQAKRLEDSCLANISERIPGLAARPVSFSGGDVIVVRIPHSYRRPHMITFRGATDFWLRHDDQKGRMSVAEIRTATTATEDLVMKVERFIEERRRAMWSQRTGPLFGLTATPLLLEEGRFSVSDQRLLNFLRDPPTHRSIAGNATVADPRGTIQPSIFGLRSTFDAQPGVYSRLDLFRNGHVEFALFDMRWLAPKGDGPTIVTGWMVVELVMNLALLVRALRLLIDVADPYLFTLSMWECRGLSMHPSGGASWLPGVLGGNEYAEGNDLLIGPILAPADEAPAATARTIADLFWNAFRFFRCPYFDAEGKFNLS